MGGLKSFTTKMPTILYAKNVHPKKKLYHWRNCLLISTVALDISFRCVVVVSNLELKLKSPAKTISDECLDPRLKCGGREKVVC